MHEDALLRQVDLHSLTQKELVEVCLKRGMKPAVTTADEKPLQRRLQAWLNMQTELKHVEESFILHAPALGFPKRLHS